MPKKICRNVMKLNKKAFRQLTEGFLHYIHFKE